MPIEQVKNIWYPAFWAGMLSAVSDLTAKNHSPHAYLRLVQAETRSIQSAGNALLFSQKKQKISAFFASLR
ncbi:MAG: hypothetical protein CO094_10050 [Anaerolineae bacterium CG_4_9_14_3_um_filter_57_17]|nr:MAG: hypothetical protein AUK01_04010 [Anaerolineae bacterium CG2_30_57_67]PJB65429.1 MAG: hypothetical protein CO094_10050 [Anaerolineae bacterium CG_4_9_14_3_um_filter_57_17]